MYKEWSAEYWKVPLSDENILWPKFSTIDM